MKNKLRISFTLLSLWSQGKQEEALVYYFKLGSISSPAMLEGKKWDKYAEEFVKQNLFLPKEFGGIKLSNPKTQHKIELSYNEQFDLVGVFDILDEPVIYELKAGKAMDSGDYANGFQVGMYFLLAKDFNIEKAEIIHYDTKTGDFDKSIVYNTKFQRNRTRNFIESIGGDIYSYFQQNNLFK